MVVLIVVVLGLGGGIFVARRVLRRIDAMTGTTQAIMRRPERAAAGRAQRRRTRPPGGKSQRHAGADRGPDDGLKKCPTISPTI